MCWHYGIKFTPYFQGLVKKTDPSITLYARAPSQYPKRRLFVRSRKVSKPRDWYFKLSHRFEIWQAHRQHCCRSACQISERSDDFKYKSRGFETLRDLTERRLLGYWDAAQAICSWTVTGITDITFKYFSSVIVAVKYISTMIIRRM